MKTDLIVGDGATVSFVTITDWDAGAIHGGHHALMVGRDAQVRVVAASLGGDVTRMAETARYAGPGVPWSSSGCTSWTPASTSSTGCSSITTRPGPIAMWITAARCKGGAHSVWVGDVLIRKVAEGINTYETNKNLVLTDGCRADSVPNLEIETGEIEGAGHSSTTGRFDDEQLFYLRSRGIPEDEARRLVVHGFFADIIRRIGVPEVEERLMVAVEQELAVMVGGANGAGE